MYQDDKLNENASPVEEKKATIKIDDLNLEIDEALLAEDEGTPANEAPEDSDTGQPSEDKGQLPDDFVKRFEGKSNDELMKVIYDSQKQIGKLGNLVGETKAKSADEVEAVKTQISDTERSIKIMREKMEEFDDEYDADEPEYQKLKKEIASKEKKIGELKVKEQQAIVADMVKKELYQLHNKDALVTERGKLDAELGMTLPDNVWEPIAELSQQIAGIGNKVSDTDVRAAAMKTIGYEAYAKIVGAQAQQAVRSDIARAKGKAVEPLPGSGATSMKLSEMTETQIDKMLDHLYKTDYNKFQEVAEKIREM